VSQKTSKFPDVDIVDMTPRARVRVWWSSNIPSFSQPSRPSQPSQPSQPPTPTASLTSETALPPATPPQSVVSALDSTHSIKGLV
jgi:hypothetical protein